MTKDFFFRPARRGRDSHEYRRLEGNTHGFEKGNKLRLTSATRYLKKWHRVDERWCK